MDSSLNGYEYIGPFVYSRDGENLTLSSADMSCGRFVRVPGQDGLVPEYWSMDYLGSVRARDTAGEVRFYDYTPYGSLWNTSLPSSGDNPHGFNGKEFQSFDSVNLYDYGARMYSPVIPMWTTPDPLFEKNHTVNPLSFCAGDPVNYVDPDGRDWVYSLVDSTYVWMDDVSLETELPSHLRYIGASNDDVLSDLGFPKRPDKQTVPFTLYYVAFDSFSSLALGAKIPSVEYLSSSLLTSRNEKGCLAVSGVRLWASFVCKDINNGLLSFAPSGALEVIVSGGSICGQMLPSNSYIRPAYSLSFESSVEIPLSTLKERKPMTVSLGMGANDGGTSSLSNLYVSWDILPKHHYTFLLRRSY